MNPEPKINSARMELAIANLFGYRTHTIVPNVSWGLGFGHECDLLILDAKHRFTEVEIKISNSDLKADFNKGHDHKSKYISRLVYAVPEKMIANALGLVPPHCGLISVKWSGYSYKARWERQCKHDKTKTLPDQQMLTKFFHLGCMRIWTLKQHLQNKMN